MLLSMELELNISLLPKGFQRQHPGEFFPWQQSLDYHKSQLENIICFASICPTSKPAKQHLFHQSRNILIGKISAE